jgi:hypothetical protein
MTPQNGLKPFACDVPLHSSMIFVNCCLVSVPRILNAFLKAPSSASRLFFRCAAFIEAHKEKISRFDLAVS